MLAYAITDPSTLYFQTLQSDIKRFFKKADILVYRDKSNQNYHLDAKIFLEEAKKYHFSKILLHSDYQLAQRLDADGVHLKSTQCHEIALAKALGLFVVISTHSIEEALEAELEGADMITFSPIFSTPNKGQPKGLEALNELVRKVGIPVVALGGILSKKQIESCQKQGAKGFASIRYFS
jgi:thiamine-phosphate pyrophosphorylase